MVAPGEKVLKNAPQRDAVEHRRLVHVLQQPPGRAHEHVHLVHRVLLLFHVLPADEQPRAEGVVLPRGEELLEDLHRELSGGRDDEPADAVLPPPLRAVQRLEKRNHERERLSAARLRRAEDVAPRERVRDRRALDGGELLKSRVREAALRRRRQRHVFELPHADERRAEAFLAGFPRRDRERVRALLRFRRLRNDGEERGRGGVSRRRTREGRKNETRRDGWAAAGAAAARAPRWRPRVPRSRGPRP
eukprot:31310-Pelagococcus_subviridis.AAC.9